jgi:polyferredoxin
MVEKPGVEAVGRTMIRHSRKCRIVTINRQRIRKSLLATMLVLFQYRLFHLFFSPVLVVVAASQGIVNGSLLIYVLLFLASLFFGRAWCGWLCPGAAINEACSMIVRKRCNGGRADKIKYVVFALLAGLIGFMAIRAGGFHSVDPLFGMDRRSLLQDIILLLGGVAIIVPIALRFGRFGNCHYVCWEAPIMIIGTRIKETVRWPSLHLTVNPEACTGCGKCDQHCPMSLPVAAMAQRGSLRNTECILCGNCVDHCQAGVIRYAFGVPNRIGSLSRGSENAGSSKDSAWRLS